MSNVKRKYAIRKLSIGAVSLIVGLSATNSSYIQAKEIETIAKLIYKDGKVAAGENDSLKASLVFNDGLPYAEVYAYKNVKNLLVEVTDKDGKVYKTKVELLKSGESTYVQLEAKGKILPKTSADSSKEEVDREFLKFTGYLDECKYDIRVSYDIDKESDTKVENKSAPDLVEKQSQKIINETNNVVSKEVHSYSEVAVPKAAVNVPVVKHVETKKPVMQAPVTEVVTEAPVTKVVTEEPVTRIVTEAPVTREVTEAPVTRIVTEAPATRIVTEAPVTRVVTQQPAPIVVSNDETTQVVTQAPIVQVITEAPVTRIVTEAPATRVVTEVPATKIVTEVPVTRVVTEVPVTKVVTEVPVTKIIGKTPALVQPEKISIPLESSKGENPPVVEEKPSIPAETSKGTTLVQEEKPSIPAEISKGTALVQEEKPSIPAETSKGTGLVQEEKPSIPAEISKGQTPPTLDAKKDILVEEELLKIPFGEDRVDDKTLLVGTENRIVGTDGTRKIVKLEGKVHSDEIIKNPVNTLIKIGVKKEKPNLSYINIDTDDLTKELNISYNLADQHKAYIRSRVAIYDGDKLVRELDIDDLDSVMDELEHYDTPYRLVTTMTYDINDGKGPQEEILEDRIVEIPFKKIEIKDVDSATLFKHENENTRVVSTLSTIPNDKDKYFVRVTSDRFRDKLLPVSNIEEVVVDGVAYYKVTSIIDELVEDKDSSIVSEYKEGFTFLVQKVEQSQGDVYSNFKDLVAAVKKNPTGTFKLGAELYADDLELAKGENSYLGDFSGSLIGANNGVNYAIYGLKAPLFSKLSGSVSDLDLEKVTINTSDVLAGSLAREAANATITNVAATGSIRSQRTIGGLVGQTTGSTINNVSFKGDLYSTNNTRTGQAFVGGVVGYMTSGDLSRAYVDAQINAFAGSGNQRAGGIVGQATNGNISKVYSKGDLVARSTRDNTSAGIIASVYQNASLEQAVSEMNVPNGILIMADSGHAAAKVDNSTVAVVEGTVSKSENTWSTKISKEEATKRLDSYGITATVEDSKDNRVNNILTTDYTKLHKASPDRETAYLNIEKLIPFYNKEQIVKYGNLVETSDKLYTTKLLSVTPMLNDTVLSNVAKDKTSLNKLMLYYEDGTIAYVDVKYKEDFKNTSISEYDIGGTKLIYTPEQFISDYSDIVAATSGDLKAVKFKSEVVLNALGLVVDNAEVAKLVATGLTEEAAKEKFISDKMEQLYLEETFEKVKSQIDQHLADALATDKSINTTKEVINNHIIDYIKDNKEQLLLGLSYVQRWYNINFDGFNFQKLATFHQDFFGKPVNTLEWLVGLAKAGYENIRPANNVTTYSNDISENTGIATQVDYLSKLRQLFLPNKTDAEWFKDNTKAYIVEQKSKENPDIDVSFWKKAKDSVGVIPQDEINGLLPLLTADEGIFIITNMASITYSMYDRYIDMSLKDTNPAEYEKQVAELKNLIDRTAKAQADNLDVWYRMLDEDAKQALSRVVPIWDGYRRFDKNWIPKYGVDAKSGLTPNEAMKDFFGPIGSRSDVDGNYYALARANGWQVQYILDAMLTESGLVSYAHEMTHILDSRAFLDGHGRRDRMGGESFATGMFEAPVYNSDVLAYNFIFDNSEKADAKDRYQALSPDRFKDASDLQEYTKGTLDVLYTLDYAESRSILSKPEADQKKWFIKIENSTNANGGVIGRYRALTDVEWDAIQLDDINDLIDNDIMTRRGYASADNKELTRNYYDAVNMFAPIYSALANDNDAPSSSLMFKLRAYEVMAAKGYQDGFLPYASNQLNAEAKAEGLETQTEKFVLDKIFNGKYTSWADFKKETYQERIAKVNDLKPITIEYNGSSVTISHFNQLQSMMDEAVNQDLLNDTIANSKESQVHALKAAVYNAYLRETNDFTTSIYS